MVQFSRLSNAQIGALISGLRKKQGMTGGELAKRSGMSQSKISKIETGFYARPRTEELVQILNILDASKNILQQVAASSSKDSPKLNMMTIYQQLESNASPENRATKTIRFFCTSMIPAILQTVGYRTALLHINGVKDIAGELRRTAVRQDALWEGTKTYHIIISEAALYTRLGTAKVQLGQLDRIERMIDLPGRTIGILPVEAGMAPADLSQFIIYDESLVVDCLQNRELSTKDAEVIDVYLHNFKRLEALTVYGYEAIERIRRAMEHFR